MNNLNWDIPKLKKSPNHAITRVKQSIKGNWYFTVNRKRISYPTKFEAMTARDLLAKQHGKKQLYFPLKVKIPKDSKLNLGE